MLSKGFNVNAVTVTRPAAPPPVKTAERILFLDSTLVGLSVVLSHVGLSVKTVRCTPR